MAIANNVNKKAIINVTENGTTKNEAVATKTMIPDIRNTLFLLLNEFIAFPLYLMATFQTEFPAGWYFRTALRAFFYQ